MRRIDSSGAGFLYGETEHWHMHVSSLLILDPADEPDFSFERVSRAYVERVASTPQFRSRLREVPFGLDRPVLVEDPDFDPGLHLHHAAVPAPGGPRETAELVSEIIAAKLDRSRPLWEAWYLEGLADGRVALVVKIHHAIIDGVSGVALAGLIMDTEPHPPPAPPAEPVPLESGPSTPELALRAVGSLATLPLRGLRFANQTVRQSVALVRSRFGADVPPMAFSAPRSLLNRPLSPHRSFAYTAIPLARAQAVKRAFGVKLNDVVLAIVGGALRQYLLERDALPSSALVAQVPVSIRSERTLDEVGTQVANMFTTLATDVADPGERLLRIHAVTERAKHLQHDFLDAREVAVPDLAPPAVLGLAARAYEGAHLEGIVPPIYNVIVSNVPGPTFDLYVAGARVEAMYPMGPLLFGSGLNITALSSRDTIQFGFLASPASVPDPWRLAELVEAELVRLVAAASEA